MDIKTIIAISGILSIVIAVIGGSKIKTNWFELSPLDKKARVFLGGIGFFLLILLVYFFLSPELSNSNAQSTQTAFSLTQLSFESSRKDLYATQTAIANFALGPVTTTNPSPATVTITPTIEQTEIAVSATTTPSLIATINAESESKFESVLFCVNYYSVLVNTGPGDYFSKKSILVNPYNLSNPSCLLFDLRMPDNSWIRIASKQTDTNYSEFEAGWIKSDQVSPANFDKLKVYIPDSVLSGEYCITSRNGVKIRSCPNDRCETKIILALGDCLIFDARTSDNKWARISQNQKDNKYLPFAGSWVNSYFISPIEFSVVYNPYVQFYLGLLEVVTPIPTPDG